MHECEDKYANLKLNRNCILMFTSRLSAPLRLALSFLCFGILWILLTDVIVKDMAANQPATLSKLQTYKGIVFMILAAMMIFYTSRKIITRHLAVHEQLEAEKIRYMKDVGIEVLKAQEHERKKIGEELHDNINQILGVTKLYIEHAQMNPAAREEMLSKSSEFLNKVINEVRAVSKSLISPTLTDIGLVESIHELTNSILGIRNIEIEVNAEGFNEKVITATQKLMLYRITQEQLNNILKHSKAEHVYITLAEQNGTVSLTIEDDGIGFNPSQASDGIGLKNIRHRLELLNGCLHIESAPQQGCRLQASFPTPKTNDLNSY
jgi:signal transduction histidine kinase